MQALEAAGGRLSDEEELALLVRCGGKTSLLAKDKKVFDSADHSMSKHSAQQKSPPGAMHEAPSQQMEDAGNEGLEELKKPPPLSDR